MRLLRNIFVAQKNYFYSLFRKYSRQDRAHDEEKQNAEVPILNFHPHFFLIMYKRITWNKLRKVLPIIAGVLTIIAKVQSIVVPNHVLPKMPI